MGVWARLLGAAAVIGLTGVASLPDAARAQTAPVPATARPTAQQLFQSGHEAFQAGEYAKALEIFSALEARSAGAPRTLSIARVRKGLALTELGRVEEAKAALEAGLPGLSETDASLREDRFAAEVALGRLERTLLAYDAALEHYARAESLADGPVARFNTLMPQADLGIFVDPQAALGVLERADALLRSDATLSASKDATAQLVTIRGRLLMNLGRFDEAEKSLALAVRNLGGLTLRVDYGDLVTRSDASIAALLAGHKSAAYNYLVYSGAGRLEKEFPGGADMDLPVCGEDGVRPEDVAVVEFGIGDNGAVLYARPIYGSRQGDMALVFARAVARWSWLPEEVKEIPTLFRFVTRLELRCTTIGGGPDVTGAAAQAFTAWLESRTTASFEFGKPTASGRRDALLAERARLLAAGGEGQPALLPVLAVLATNSTVSSADRTAYATTLRQMVVDRKAPPLVRLYADIILAGAAARSKRERPELVVAEDAYLDDPAALATLRLARYDSIRPSRKARNAGLLDSVISDARLPADDSLKTAALIRRASLRASLKDLDGARADYGATGLTAQQCSIVDARPSMRRSNAGSEDYPADIVRMGVDGWSRVQFDISADGKTLNQRAVISYPPFIFDRSSEKIIAGALYEQSYRPAGDLGCGGSMHGIVFRAGH